MKINGNLEAFMEQGLEGVAWSIHKTGCHGYDGLHCLDAGDYLTVFDKVDSTKIAWQGKLDLEYERTVHVTEPDFDDIIREYVMPFTYGIQKGVSIRTWQEWFYGNYPATLERKGPHSND